MKCETSCCFYDNGCKTIGRFTSATFCGCRIPKGKGKKILKEMQLNTYVELYEKLYGKYDEYGNLIEKGISERGK